MGYSDALGSVSVFVEYKVAFEADPDFVMMAFTEHATWQNDSFLPDTTSAVRLQHRLNLGRKYHDTHSISLIILALLERHSSQG